jgi:phage shock protein PspC (stress-responsive transcriptional regulator)
MHTVINIDLVGNPSPYRVHEDAYAALSGYLGHAQSRLAGDPDRAEVMGDLERSIGAKLTDRLGSSDRILTIGDVTAVLEEVGAVGTHDGQPTPIAAGRPRRRRLRRIHEGQEVAGLCTGLATYSEINVDYIRTIFLVLAVVTAGLFALVYFAVALVVPVVPTHEAWIAQMEADGGS